MRSSQSSAASTRQTPADTVFWRLDRRESAILAAIVLVTITIYLPSLRNGWVADDWELFVDNKLIHSWSFVWNSFRYDSFWFRNPASLPQSLYYRPLANLWFATNALLFGTNPVAWHLTKVVLHAIAVVLCFRLAQLLTGEVAVGLLAAAIFGVMPAQVGAVVWASAIPEPLSTVFELWAMIVLIGRKPGWSRGLFISAILYGCAILTHESAVLFPLVVFAYVFLFEGGYAESDGKERAGRTTERIVLACRVCAPFLFVAIIYMGARLNALGLNFLLGPHYANSAASAMIARGFIVLKPRYSLAQILMTMPVVVSAYLAVLAFPMMAGPAHAVEWATHPQLVVFISTAVLATLAVTAFVLASRGSNRRLYLFCAVWSLITMAPALNLNALFTLVEDRYLYAPSFGWSLAVAVAAFQIAAVGSRARYEVGVAMGVLLVLYAASTTQIERYWNDDVTYLQRCVEIAPFHLDYRDALVNAMNKRGDFDGAVRVLQGETALYPDDAHVRLKLARQYQRMGRVVDFEREFQKFNELSAATMLRQRAAAGSQPPSPQ